MHNDSEFSCPLYLATTLSPVLLLKKNKYYNFSNHQNAMYTFTDVHVSLQSYAYALVFQSHLIFQWLVLPWLSRDIAKLAVEAKLWDIILTLASVRDQLQIGSGVDSSVVLVWFWMVPGAFQNISWWVRNTSVGSRRDMM